MKHKNLFVAIFALFLISCNTSWSNEGGAIGEKKEQNEPNYNVALNFMNEYVSRSMNPYVDIVDWVNERKDVTNDFKAELKRILDKAAEEDPIMGLGFDPILNAQDSPGQFELDYVDSEFVIVKGVDYSEFQLALKLKYENNAWLLDGAGIINIDSDKRVN